MSEGTATLSYMPVTNSLWRTKGAQSGSIRGRYLPMRTHFAAAIVSVIANAAARKTKGEAKTIKAGEFAERSIRLPYVSNAPSTNSRAGGRITRKNSTK